MAGKTLDIDDLIQRDNLGCIIANQWLEWDGFRDVAKKNWTEVQRYIYQTDASQTTNVQTPWKNKTTTPKLCQIRDNLYANYIATLFPKARWLLWEGANKDSQSKDKRNAIRNYMSWVIDRREFKDVLNRLILDYIDYGNVFAAPDWEDARIELPDKTQVGYCGPVPTRINPYDVVMNPLSTTSDASPKIIRSYLSLGELKKQLMAMTPSDDHEELSKLFTYLRDIRLTAQEYAGSIKYKDELFDIAGFGNFKQYLGNSYVEVLTFHGDMYDIEKDELLQNYKIMVVDRHKVVYKKPNPSFFAKPPIIHCGWRLRQDNLWAMGPLDNLVGLQYRLDHLENMKADIIDLTAFPVQVIKGFVGDYTWQPMEKIIVGDEGDVELRFPDGTPLQMNMELDALAQKMEEMAGSPREAMGIRTPGEKTMYEVQRLENATARIFQNKVAQFEEQELEPLLNSMLELARRKMNNTTIRIWNDEFQSAAFQQLSPEDITGIGRLKPVAARHFAERAQLVQNMNNFRNSVAGQDPGVMNHFSGIKEAKMWEEILDLEDWGLVQENIRVSEAADTQRLMNVQQEQVMMEAGTPAGLAEDDVG